MWVGKVSDLKGPSLEHLINQFQSNLEQINNDQIQPLPDLTGGINHNGKYVRFGRDIEPGIYLDDGDNGSGLYQKDVEFTFQAQPGHRLTREDSHNKVFFGRLWLLSEGEGPEKYAQVAIKSMDNNRKEHLVGELALFQHIGRIGLSTFRPAGLVVAEHESHLMTYFDGPVMTMDTVNWEDMTAAEAWVELDKAVDTAAQLHTNLLFHGDLLFRNIAFDETGDTVIIDPELTSSARNLFDVLADAPMILNDDQNKALGVLVSRMNHEFNEVCNSIDENIIKLLPKAQRPRNDTARLKLYKDHLYEPYKARIRSVEEPVRSVLLRVYDEMITHKKALAKDGQL